MSDPAVVLVSAGGDVAVVEQDAVHVVVVGQDAGPLVLVDPVGIPGPAGPPGPAGVPGPAGSDANAAHVHAQIGPSAAWTVVHELGFRPNVTVVDSGGTVVEGTVVYISASELTITFSAAFSGTAYLS